MIITDKEYLQKNIETAQKYLDHFHLLISVNELIMDCIFLPSFRWKTYYIQVKCENGVYIAHCAYTRYYELGAESFSQSFLRVEKTDEHPSGKGDVFCKIIYPDSGIVNTIAEQAAEYKADVTENKLTVIDGIDAGVRLFRNGNITKDNFLPNYAEESSLLETLISLSEMI